MGMRDDLSCESFDLQHNLAGWSGWLDDPNSGTRQFAARMASEVLRDCGLTWQDVARLVVGEVRRRAGKSGR
jgi:hypothetical protein